VSKRSPSPGDSCCVAATMVELVVDVDVDFLTPFPFV
jgi:hypothetical protein